MCPGPPPARPRARPSVRSFVNGQSLEYITSLWELLGYVLRLLRSYRPRSPDLPGPVRPSPCRLWFTVATPPRRRRRRRPCLLTYSAPRSPFSTCTSFVHTAAPFLLHTAPLARVPPTVVVPAHAPSPSRVLRSSLWYIHTYILSAAAGCKHLCYSRLHSWVFPVRSRARPAPPCMFAAQCDVLVIIAIARGVGLVVLCGC